MVNVPSVFARVKRASRGRATGAVVPKKELSERTGEDGWIRADADDLATHNDGDLLSVLGTQFQFTAEELRGRNRTSLEGHVPHWGAVHEDGLG